jgi:uncharacterized membrane protein
MNVLGTVIILQALVFGGFSAYLAKEKGRDAVGWFLLGACFSLIALIAIAATPKLDSATTSTGARRGSSHSSRRSTSMMITIECPSCHIEEDVERAQAKYGQTYKKFEASYDSKEEIMKLRCLNCDYKFVLPMVLDFGILVPRSDL